MHRWWSIAFRESNANPASGGGGGSSAPAAKRYSSAEIAQIAADVEKEPDLRRAIDDILSRNNGDSRKAIEYASRRGYKAREQRNAILEENKRLAALLPSDSDVVVRGDDAKHVKAIIDNAKKAGLSLADVASKVETIPQTEAELKKLSDERTAQKAAGQQYNQAALAKAVTDDGYVFIEKDVTSKIKGPDGKDVTKTEKVWHVKKADEKDDKAVTVDSYVANHVFKDAILSKKGGSQSDASSSVEWHSQSNSAGGNGDSGSSTDAVGKLLEQNKRLAEAPSAMDFAFGTIGV